MKATRVIPPAAARPAAPAPTPPARSEPGPSSSGARDQVPAQWAWHHRTLLHLRERLQRAQADHASQAASPPDLDSNDLADSAQDRSDRDLLWAELGAEKNQLFEVDCALQRIRDGTYGFCAATGRPIPPARLRAVPWTRYSRAAAQSRETPPPPGSL